MNMPNETIKVDSSNLDESPTFSALLVQDNASEQDALSSSSQYMHNPANFVYQRVGDVMPEELRVAL